MTQTTEKKTPTQTGDEFVRMYPSNHLNEQVRQPRETLSAFTVIKAAFFEKE